jgi:hypothetical protein
MERKGEPHKENKQIKHDKNDKKGVAAFTRKPL